MGRKRTGTHFSTPGCPGLASKLPGGALYPPTSSFRKRTLRLGCRQSRETLLQPGRGCTHAHTTPRQLRSLQDLKSPPSPPRGRQEGLGEGETAREWPPTCKRSGAPCEPGVLREGTRRSAAPPRCRPRSHRPGPPPLSLQPPPRWKSGGRRGPRAAEGAAGTGAASTPARSRTPDCRRRRRRRGSLMQSGSAVRSARVESASDL